MTERRARGTSPAGRGDRRSSRSSRSSRVTASNRSTASSRTSSGSTRTRSEQTGEAAPAAPTTRTTPGKRATPRRRPGSAEKSERKFLGLSTGRAVILAAVLCALALTLAVPMRTYFSQRAQASHLSEQRKSLEQDVARLRERQAQQQDPNYIKSEARDRLRLVMPGETPYIVQVPGIEQPAVPVPTAAPRQPDPWYTQLWHSVSNPQPAAPQPPPPNPQGATR